MITVENLTKSFPGKSSPVLALREVNLEIDAGALYGVVGPAKSGKSTLARVVALQEKPDRGTVRLDGLNTASLDGRRLREARRQVAVLDPAPALNAERTIAGNVAAPLERLGVDGPQRRNRVGRVLDLVGLTQRATQQPGELTEAQRRRVAIARALVAGPAVLLADDPTAGIPADEAGPVLTVLDRARAELGVTVLLTTQEGSIVGRVCDEVAVLDSGRVIEHGTVLDLLASPGSRIAETLLPAIDTPRAQTAAYDRAADVVLIGFATVGALLPEASMRFGVELATIGGGLARVGDTPVARFRIGVRGRQADSALAWIADRGAHVTHLAKGPCSVAA
ncbi:methionine ABC transporter ATP-binding protein [Amycolatopsis alkalitolerans]|uniref:ATP-binding cassette domain-containing protein n=1 Tax=Amycolatopsis alkalitolerans TaxID=2547244 RepID=A0A5C4MBZ4_9PSEU|nr:ATP-binding cassette domain-containing protein [Amycolatopsis alkalitolerans]TNC29531.1 ATP-binding cassette domain-containing protein [Amycolatopsis alkalitolerans]